MSEPSPPPSAPDRPVAPPAAAGSPRVKLPTGIVGLDDVLGGGIPNGSMTLLSGGPGTGKTLIALEFLVRGAEQGRPGILLTFEERESDLRGYGQGFGWDIPRFEANGLLLFVSARIRADAVIAGDFDLRGILGILRHRARQMGAQQVVIDAPDVFLRLLDNIRKERNELQVLHEWLRDAGMTTLLTVKRALTETQSLHYDFLDYLADCVIYLDQRVSDQITTRRLRVLKLRGSSHGRNEYPFGITDRGVWIIPVTQASLQHRSFGDYVSTGVPGLDRVLGGGLRRHSCTLFTGSSGTGKTTFVCAFVRAATGAGERVLYLDFEESWEALASCMLSPGIDLSPARASGRLEFISAMPESQGIEEHLIQAFRAMDRVRPHYLVVDAISACRRMGSQHAAFDYLLRLINRCKQHGITTLLTNLSGVPDPRDELTGIDLSSVIDTVILLRNIETADGFHRKLGVLKSRGSRHSHRIHDFEITDHGIQIALTEQP